MNIEDNTVYVFSHSHTFIRVIASRGIQSELSEAFTFEIPGARFHPKVKNKMWDGKIRLYNILNGEIYAGLYEAIKEFAADRDYKLVSDYSSKMNFTADMLNDISDKLELSREDEDGDVLPLEFREDQLDTITVALRDKRRLIKSAVSSGKSAMIYTITRILLMMKKRVLIIVPTINLVTQLYDNFKEYSHYNKWDVDKHCHKIFKGASKITTKPVIISTWQSIYDQDAEWFEDFRCLIVDEAHEATAQSIRGIAEKTYKAPFKLGFTGTLTGKKTHKMMLEGIFGPVHEAITTAEMIEKGYAPNLLVRCIIIKHRKQDCDWLHKWKPENKEKAEAKEKYDTEYKFIIGNQARNKLLAKLVSETDRNCLVLFTRVEDHGMILNDLFEKTLDKPVYFIHGGIDGEKRAELIKQFAQEKNAVMNASFGTTHRGISVKNMFSLFMASMYKSQTKILQSIGRGMRTHKDKEIFIANDIVDDMTYVTKGGKEHHNYTYKQFLERLKIYQAEGFKVEIKTIELETYYD